MFAPKPKNTALTINKTGFTLIELVVGIAVLATALTFMTGALIPQAQRSVDPWFQVRSAELANSMMSEILARSYDENSSRNGNPLRCGEVGALDCIDNLPSCDNANTWTEETSREIWDDVDDFHCYSATGDEITNIENDPDGRLTGVYQQFTVSVEVQYAGNDLGFTNNDSAKSIVVTVTHPNSIPIVYASYRTNY